QRAGKHDLLPLPAGQVDAVLPRLGQRRVPAEREPVEHVDQAGVAGGALQNVLRRVSITGGGAELYVLAGGQRVLDEILEDDRQLTTPRGVAEIPDIHAVSGDPALGWLVETGEDLGHGGLAGAVEPDHREQ